MHTQETPLTFVHRFNRQLAGLTHPNKHGRVHMDLVRAMPMGTPLVLVPEPDNQHDRNAI
jgi:hypothetical protein